MIAKLDSLWGRAALLAIVVACVGLAWTMRRPPGLASFVASQRTGVGPPLIADVSSSEGGKVIAWDWTTGRRWTIPTPRFPRDYPLAVSQDGRSIAYIDADGAIVQTGVAFPHATRRVVADVSRPDVTQLLRYDSIRGFVAIWRIPTLRGTGELHSVDLETGRVVDVVRGITEVLLPRKWQDLELAQEWKGEEDARYASCWTRMAVDERGRFQTISTSAESATLKLGAGVKSTSSDRGYAGLTISASGTISRDGRRVILVRTDGFAVADVATGAELMRIALPEPRYAFADFSDDGEHLVVEHRPGWGLAVYEVASGRRIRTEWGQPIGCWALPAMVLALLACYGVAGMLLFRAVKFRWALLDAILAQLCVAAIVYVVSVMSHWFGMQSAQSGPAGEFAAGVLIGDAALIGLVWGLGGGGFLRRSCFAIGAGQLLGAIAIGAGVLSGADRSIPANHWDRSCLTVAGQMALTSLLVTAGVAGACVLARGMGWNAQNNNSPGESLQFGVDSLLFVVALVASWITLARMVDPNTFGEKAAPLDLAMFALAPPIIGAVVLLFAWAPLSRSSSLWRYAALVAWSIGIVAVFVVPWFVPGAITNPNDVKNMQTALATAIVVAAHGLWTARANGWRWTHVRGDVVSREIASAALSGESIVGRLWRSLGALVVAFDSLWGRATLVATIVGCAALGWTMRPAPSLSRSPVANPSVGPPMLAWLPGETGPRAIAWDWRTGERWTIPTPGLEDGEHGIFSLDGSKMLFVDRELTFFETDLRGMGIERRGTLADRPKDGFALVRYDSQNGVAMVVYRDRTTTAPWTIKTIHTATGETIDSLRCLTFASGVLGFRELLAKHDWRDEQGAMQGAFTHFSIDERGRFVATATSANPIRMTLGDPNRPWLGPLSGATVQVSNERSPDGQSVTAKERKDILVADVATGTIQMRLKDLDLNRANLKAFSQDSKHFLVHHKGWGLAGYEVATGKRVFAEWEQPIGRWALPALVLVLVACYAVIMSLFFRTDSFWWATIDGALAQTSLGTAIFAAGNMSHWTGLEENDKAAAIALAAGVWFGGALTIGLACALGPPPLWKRLVVALVVMALGPALYVSPKGEPSPMTGALMLFGGGLMFASGVAAFFVPIRWFGWSLRDDDKPSEPMRFGVRTLMFLTAIVAVVFAVARNTKPESFTANEVPEMLTAFVVAPLVFGTLVFLTSWPFFSRASKRWRVAAGIALGLAIAAGFVLPFAFDKQSNGSSEKYLVSAAALVALVVYFHALFLARLHGWRWTYVATAKPPEAVVSDPPPNPLA